MEIRFKLTGKIGDEEVYKTEINKSLSDIYGDTKPTYQDMEKIKNEVHRNILRRETRWNNE